MSVYPHELTLAAKNLLDNNDFHVLLRYRLSDLEQAVLSSDEPAMILDTHKEYSHIKDFASWIEMLGKAR